MKTEYTVAIATFAGIAIGGVAVQASPSYNDVRTIGNKYAKFRIVAAEGPSQ
jgi:hypothetical protein